MCVCARVCSCPRTALLLQCSFEGGNTPVPPNSARGLRASALWGALRLGVPRFSPAAPSFHPAGGTRDWGFNPAGPGFSTTEVLGLGLWVLACKGLRNPC